MANYKQIALYTGGVLLLTATIVAVANAQKLKSLSNKITMPNNLNQGKLQVEPQTPTAPSSNTPTQDIFNVVLDKIKSIFSKSSNNTSANNTFVGINPNKNYQTM